MSRSLRVLLPVAALSSTYAAMRPGLRTWGATEHERRARMAGDELLLEPRYQTTRAVDIGAPPADVWAYLAQLGQGRGGLYSYDWLENLAGGDVHSVRGVVPQWQSLTIGDEVRLASQQRTDRLRLCVAQVEPPRRLLLASPGTPQAVLSAGLPYLTWSFEIRNRPCGGARLVVRTRGELPPGRRASRAESFLVEPAHWVMERKMLDGIRRRAERRAARRSGS